MYLVNLKAKVDKIDVGKLKTVPVDLIKIINVVNNVVKKIVYYKLVTKVKNISISGFVLKTKCDKEKSNFEKEIHDTSGLVKETDYNAKITEIENKIAISSCVATNAALTAVEKNPDVSSLVKKKNKKIIMQIFVKLKRSLLIIITINILLLQNLISLQQKFLLQD